MVELPISFGLNPPFHSFLPSGAMHWRQSQKMLPRDAYLISGAMRVEAGIQDRTTPRVFNSVYVINHEGEIVSAADKMHLVPFGEYLPFQEYLESLGLMQLTGIKGGFTAGARRSILSTKSAGRFLPLICYEIVFPGKILPDNQFGPDNTENRDAGEPASKDDIARPNWIVNVTNDAWFGKTSGPYQHHRQAVVRGVEEGLPVVRAANSGISSVSDSFGRIHAYLGLGESGSLDAKLPLPAGITFFQYYRNYGFLVICAFMFLGSLWRSGQKNQI